MKVAKNVIHSSKTKAKSSTDKLIDLELVPPDHIEAISKACKELPFSITPHLLKIIKSEESNAPISKQFIPSHVEIKKELDELKDPIGDIPHSPVNGIVHRYPDRVLLTPTLTCPVYCRFCFRREAVGNGMLSYSDLKNALDYIQNHSEIWEVILSGGDPLSLATRRLRELIGSINEIEHVGVVRIHTRVPILDPKRITSDFIDALKCEKPVFIVVHCNHSNELVSESEAAISRLVDNGFPMLSQSVLLKGINDDAETLSALMKKLVQCRVKPYYLHHGDKAEGTSHFRTTLAVGQKIIRKLRGQISGLCQPNYMLDIPNGHGKVPVGPSYLQVVEENNWKVSDWRGVTHQYLD